MFSGWIFYDVDKVPTQGKKSLVDKKKIVLKKVFTADNNGFICKCVNLKVFVSDIV
jgi:hypothetical protein